MAPPQKKYICGYCARAFTRSEHKQRHERSHTNEKPFHCLYCPSAFVRRDLLQRHCRTVHNIRLVLRPAKDTDDTKRVSQPPPDEMAANKPPASPGDDGMMAEVALAKMLLQLVPAFHAAEDARYGPAVTPGHAARPGLAPAEEYGAGDPRLARLYAVAKKLARFYDPADLRLPMDEMFLAGYWVLAHDAAAGFPAAAFVDYFHAPVEPAVVCDFKLGIAYTLLAAGALTVHTEEYDREEVATGFMNKAWNVFVERLMPKNPHLEHQSDILRNLYLLTYTYLRFFNNSLMVPYLEDSAVVIFQNLTLQPKAVLAHIVRQNLELFWRVYILVSKHKAKEMPPKFYSWFLAQPVDPAAATPLSAVMRRYALAPHLLSDPFLCDIVICTLSNELNNYLTSKALWIFDLDAALHAAIVMVNSSLDKPLLLASTAPDLFCYFKEKLIVDAPPKFKSILHDYVFKMARPYHWDLLSLTLRELNANFNFSLFMKENLHSSFHKFGNDLLRFFARDSPLALPAHTTAADLFTNLGLVSYPLLFNCNLLRLSHVSPAIVVADLDIVDLTNLNNLLLEWQVTVVKMLINVVSDKDGDLEKSVAESVVLQGLLYMLSDSTMTTPASYTPEFFLLIFNKLTKVCDMWLGFVNKTETMTTLRTNLNRFLSDLFVLALNNDRLSIDDLYVTSESILVRSRRSKSISSIDMRLSPYKKDPGLRSNSITQTPILTLPSISTSSNSNYVLMNKPPQIQEQKTLWNGTAMSPSSSLPPLQNLQVPNPHLGSPLVGGISSGNLLLPPLRSTVKSISENNFTTTE